MIRNDQQWLSVTDAFHGAAVDGNGWYSALEGLANATGSQTGELIGIGVNAAIPINIMTNIDPAFQQAFAEAGGGDPRINPRVDAGMKAPPLKVMAESDFITPDEYKRHPHYQEFARPWDIPFICLATLERQNGMLIGLAVLRSQRQGHITGGQRRTFATIVPHVRAAVRTHIALEGNGAAILTGALEALALPAFICDRLGVVSALTPTAETLITSGRGLQLKLGRLHASQCVDAQRLGDAIDAAAIGYTKPTSPLLRTVIVRSSEQDASPLVLDVVALPARDYEFSFAPRVLVIARGNAGTTARKAAILQAAYALTAAETDIALQLSAGKTAAVIAANRDVTVGTVRLQIKTILSKVGINRQIELVARLNQL